MQQSDMKLLANVCFAVGVVSVLFGVIAYLYEERQFWGYWVVYPYRDYAFPLVFVGIAFLAVGYVIMERARQEKHV